MVVCCNLSLHIANTLHVAQQVCACCGCPCSPWMCWLRSLLSHWSCRVRSCCSGSAWKIGTTTWSRWVRLALAQQYGLQRFQPCSLQPYRFAVQHMCSRSCTVVVLCIAGGLAHHSRLSRSKCIWDAILSCLQSLIMENPHNFPVDYEWALSSPVFSVSPASGIVKPKASCSVAVRWTPGTAAPAATASANKQLSAQQSSKSGQGGAAAAQSAASTGTSSSSSGNKTALMVQLPPDAGAEAAAAAAAASCQHTGFMTLKLKGGADAAPKKVMLHGELPVGLLKFKEKEINLGAVPLGCQQTFVAQLKKVGNADASYRVSVPMQLVLWPYTTGHLPTSY